MQDTPRSRLQQNSARRQGRIVRQRLKYIALTRAQGAVNGRLECRAASDMVLTASMHDHANWWSVGELVQGEVGVNGCLVDPVNMAPSYGPEEGRSNATVHSTPIATAHSISIFAGANRTKMWPQHAGKASLKLEDGSRCKHHVPRAKQLSLARAVWPKRGSSISLRAGLGCTCLQP